MVLKLWHFLLLFPIDVYTQTVIPLISTRSPIDDDWHLRSCCFGDETITHGTVVVSHPERCYQLVCQNGYIYPKFIQKEGDKDCCEFDGRLYQDGDELEGHCMIMGCRKGTWHPRGKIEECCDHCYLYDDPHIVTFDGTKYDWHERCNYSVTQTHFATKPKVGVFSDFRACNELASCLDRTTFRNDPNTIITLNNGAVFQIRANGYEFEVQEEVEIVKSENGKLPVLAWQHENCIFLLGSSNILLLHCPHRLDVWTHPINLQKLNGLCGHYNEHNLDDFKDRTGNIHPISYWPMDFPHSWLTSEQSDIICNTPCTECAETTSDPCEASQARRNYFRGLCREAVQNHTDVKGLTHYIETCSFDLCLIFGSGGNEHDARRWLLKVEELIGVVKGLT